MARRTHEESIKYWGRIVREHEASSLTIKQFCGDRGIEQTQFYKWRKQLKAQEAGSCWVAPLTPATVAGRQRESSRIEVRIDESVSVLVRVGFDESTLRQVATALRQHGCGESATC